MTVVEVQNLSKKFRLYHERTHSLKERLLRTGRNVYEEFWALKDVSFGVNKGESLGVIGANGSGKSTLLKIISKIYYATEGSVKTNGKVVALLELGSGFQPDLTGRENIYLNGSILQLTKEQLNRKFDEIVQFSELEKFIDIPLRNYSSGMQVRLGFSVAINVNADILLIDEVLAIGDESFQRKSGNKIFEFLKDGKTVIFVSHNLEAVKKLCTRAIWLNKGKIAIEGNTEEVVNAYLATVK
ncbi:MAG: ABC transporter ATP-binding protein [Candidatus Omnitrophota bacterium]